MSIDVKYNYMIHIHRKVLKTHGSLIMVVLDYTMLIFFFIFSVISKFSKVEMFYFHNEKANKTCYKKINNDAMLNMEIAKSICEVTAV